RAATGAGSLATGAQQLASALGQARTGSADLAGGLATLQDGSGRLSTGAAQVADGTQRLNDTVQPALTKAQQQLPALQRDARAASARLDTIAAQAAGGSSSISGDLDTASAQLTQLARSYPEIADDPAYVALRSRVTSAAGRADTIDAQVGQGAARVRAINRQVQSTGDLATQLGTARRNLADLSSGAQAVASGARRLDAGVGTARAGADRLATGVSSAATGADALAAGADRLSSGLGDLRTGAGDLATGLGTLRSGAQTLQSRLSKGAARIPALSADEQAQAVQVLSSPADVRMQVDNPATVYGRGLAPMFFSIALWVFGISVFLVVRPISGRALAGRASPARLALTGWLPIGVIAGLAGWLMVSVVWATLGLDPVHPFGTLALVTLGALCFSAIAHLLRTALGTPGSSLLLVWLILQLTSAGGTYPAPILPGFFRTISPYLPMTYLIDAFRVVISGGELSHLGRDVVVLVLITAAALGLCVLTVARRQQFRMRDLHPPLVAP
ncbi:MAG: putative transporter permease protein, partial [Friedmanniella sp.]|nr:putative transporter permease protein [Friedmanniella sp.]